MYLFMVGLSWNSGGGSIGDEYFRGNSVQCGPFFKVLKFSPHMISDMPSRESSCDRDLPSQSLSCIYKKQKKKDILIID